MAGIRSEMLLRLLLWMILIGGHSITTADTVATAACNTIGSTTTNTAEAATCITPDSVASYTERSKRVVFIPIPATSNVIMHANVASSLAGRHGYEVWIVVPYSLASWYVKTTKYSKLSYILLDDSGREFVPSVFPECIEGYFRGQRSSCGEVMEGLNNVRDWMLGNESFVSQLEKIAPDFFVFTDAFKSLVALPYKLDVPFALLGPQVSLLSARVPLNPAAEPFPFLEHTDHMGFRQRLVNIVVYASMFVRSLRTEYTASRYVPEKPRVSDDELLVRSELWLVETDHILDYPRPTLPNVQLIGGSSAAPVSPLPSEFRSFMDNASEGVVVAFFGSIILDVPREITEKLYSVFLRLPMKVVFRSNLTSPDPTKIMTSAWLPQNDLLGHPNTKVFVSHCGNGGQYEALYHAVPLLCTPMVNDQHYNAERTRVKGFGEVVDLRSASADEMLAAITKLLTTHAYKQAISKASRLFRERYGVPSERAAEWLDHVIERGGNHMRFSGQDMPLYQFLLLDVFAFVFVTIMLCCVVCFWSCKCLCKRHKPNAKTKLKINVPEEHIRDAG